MSRYIDADEVKNRRNIVCFRDEKTGEEVALEVDVSRFLDMIPTNANVVEVVRCVSCRFASDLGRFCQHHRNPTRPMEYCSAGRFLDSIEKMRDMEQVMRNGSTTGELK